MIYVSLTVSTIYHLPGTNPQTLSLIFVFQLGLNSQQDKTTSPLSTPRRTEKILRRSPKESKEIRYQVALYAVRKYDNRCDNSFAHKTKGNHENYPEVFAEIRNRVSGKICWSSEPAVITLQSYTSHKKEKIRFSTPRRTHGAGDEKEKILKAEK